MTRYTIKLDLSEEELAALQNAISNFEAEMAERRKECGFTRSEMERRMQITLRQCELHSVRCKLASARPVTNPFPRRQRGCDWN